jgi:hypothetical protein
MSTTFEMAAAYEQWADESDKTAEAVLATPECSNAEIRRNELARASILRHEAKHLREEAMRLRGLADRPPDGSIKD